LDWLKEHSSLEDLRQIKILDNACGEGVFLIESFYILKNIYKEKYPSIENVEKYIIENNLYGVDIEEDSVNYVANILKEISGQNDFCKTNIKLGDSLISDRNISSLAFDWEKEFPFQFDVIVGNPPYVSANNMDFRVRQHIKDNEGYEYLSGKWDLFLPFIERGLKLLKPQGMLSFIVPYGFLNQGFATKMRQWILEKFMLKAIADLHEKRIFEDATVPTCIPFILNDIKNNNNTIIYHLEKEEFSVSHTIETEKYKQSEMFMFRTENLDKHFALLNKIKGIGTQIEKHFYVSTGAEIHGKEERDALGNFISGYSRSEILETKNLVNHQPFIEGAAIPKDLELGKYCFPEIQYYINYDKHFAKMRSPKFKELFENQKIIIRKVSGPLGILATLDERKIYTSEGAILIIDINTITNEKRTNNKTSIFSLKVLLAILNSKLMHFYYQRIYGGFVNVFPNYIKPLPIPSLVSKEITKKLEERVEIALQTQKRLTLSSERFLTVMRGEFKDIKFNEKLALWHRLEWQDFVQEMKKVKAIFTKKQALEWVEVYEEEREKILSHQNIYRKAVLEIDALIYELYGLNELEIKQIEAEYEKK
jgi:hypothetical protein